MLAPPQLRLLRKLALKQISALSYNAELYERYNCADAQCQQASRERARLREIVKELDELLKGKT